MSASAKIPPPKPPRKIRGLPPIAGKNPRVLILGSFPGETSLRAREYYAHPRNQFWAVMETVFGISRDASYRDRCRELIAHEIALWDVIANCRRRGSLDSAIRDAKANDFAKFFQKYPRIKTVFCNGVTAEQHYKKLASAQLPVLRLPSTSPANAAMSLAGKIEQWKTVRDALSGK